MKVSEMDFGVMQYQTVVLSETEFRWKFNILNCVRACSRVSVIELVARLFQ